MDQLKANTIADMNKPNSLRFEIVGKFHLE